MTFATPRSLAAFMAELARARTKVPTTKLARRPRALLVSVPGVLAADEDDGGSNILFSPNLRWSNGRELLARMGRAFRARVCAVQEIQALALGHIAAGAAPDSFVLVDFDDLQDRKIALRRAARREYGSLGGRDRFFAAIDATFA